MYTTFREVFEKCSNDHTSGTGVANFWRGAQMIRVTTLNLDSGKEAGIKRLPTASEPTYEDM